MYFFCNVGNAHEKGINSYETKVTHNPMEVYTGLLKKIGKKFFFHGSTENLLHFETFKTVYFDVSAPR